MAAFSRGCNNILSRPLQFSNQFLTSSFKNRSPRIFHTNSPLNASLKPRTKPKSPTITITKTGIPKTRPNATQNTASSQTAESKIKPNPLRNATSPSANQATYISQLASRATPTLLYNAPNQRIYTIASYTGAFFCLAYTGYAYESVVIHGPEGLAPWVAVGFTIVCLMTGAIGGFLLLGPSRIIKKIFAVPIQKPVVPKARASNKGFQAPLSNDATPLNLEIHLKTLIPKFLLPIIPSFIRPTEIVMVAPALVTISQPLSPLLMATGPRPLTAVQKQQEEEEKERRKLKWRTSVMTRPFQKLGYAGREVWEGTKRVITRDGFARIGVRGKGTYKLDVRGGWMLVDGGRGSLDRLCKIRKA